MRNLKFLDEFRIPLRGNIGDEHNGMFLIRIKGEQYKIIASNGGGWDHVSVSPFKAKKIPSWNVMRTITNIFFKPDETVMQLHVPNEEYINLHEYCLHLWRPQNIEIPVPPRYMV